MNQEAQERLQELLHMEPAALTDADREFLAARRDYLSDDQKAVYGVNQPVAEEKPAKKAKEDKE